MENLSDDKRDTKSRNLFVYSLALIAIPSYFWCGEAHICMAGHMKHPPYSTIHWVNDGLWVVCMVTAAVYAVRSSIKKKILFIVPLVFLVISRISGSLGGFTFIIEYPLLLWIGVQFLIYLVLSKNHKFRDSIVVTSTIDKL